MANQWLRPWTPFFLAVVFEGSLGLLAWAIGGAVGQSPWENLSWNAGDFALGVAATVPLLAGFALCMRVPWQPLARIRQSYHEVIRPFFGASTMVELAVIAMVAGIAEEMLFRGVVQAAVGRWFGLWPGIVAASVLFGAVHLITVTYGILAALVGIYLGWSYIASGNLLVVIVAHALYDFLALVYLVRGPELRDTSPSAGGTGS